MHRGRSKMATHARRFTWLTGLGVLLLSLFGIRAYLMIPTPVDAQEQGKSSDDGILAAVEKFAKSYNARDAKGFAEIWTEKAEYLDEDSGERIEGRKAIVADFADTFIKNGNVRLEIDVLKIRPLGDGAASVEGTARVLKLKANPSRTKFLALLVRQDGKWLIDNLRENRLEGENPNAEMLEPLAWLVGSWKSQEGNQEVSLECAEVANGNFL